MIQNIWFTITKHILLILIPINILLAFLIYDSINSEVKFQDEAQIRLSQNIQKLKDLRHVQTSYKRTKGTFANNFEDLISFLESDSIPIIKANGETPDSLTDSEALKLGIISRDTAYVLAKEGVFNKEYIESRDNCIEFNLKALTTVPHSNMNYNIDAGEIEKGKEYQEKDFNRSIQIKSREEYRVKLFLSMINQKQKTLVFCATQGHALIVRDLINQHSDSLSANYCHRVTADDGKIGEQHLRDFQDNEKSIPTILTT